MAIEREKFTKEAYDSMLNECYPEVFGILPSRILSECDPIAYNCGFSDFQEYEYEYECEACGSVFDDEKEADNCCSD